MTKTLGQMSQMIASAKGAGAAVRKMLPAAAAGVMSSPTRETAPPPPPPTSSQTQTRVMSHPLQQMEDATTTSETSLDADFTRMERKFTDLRSSLVEKCQSSKHHDDVDDK